MHAPAGQEHAEHAHLAADAVGPFLARLVVGTDPQIAALAVVDAFGGDQAFGADEGGGWRALGRPADRSAGYRLARARVPIRIERHPIRGARARRVDATDRHPGLVGDAEDRAG